MSNFDSSERKIALNPTKSFIVQAPAGSGKTTILISRYLKLLSTVNNPEEILAITFTKKAAFEMRTRIIDALKYENEEINTQNKTIIQKLAKDALKQDQIKKWNIKQNPNRLRIQTIDAFCSYLINQLPIFIGIKSERQLVKDQDAETYYKKAAQALFEHLDDQEYSIYLERLLLYLNNDWEKTIDLLITMLKSREQWLPHIVGVKNSNNLRKKMEQALQTISKENIERCIAVFPKKLYLKLVNLLRSSRNNLELPENIHLLSTAHWLMIAKTLLTKEFTWRKKITVNQGFPGANAGNSKTEKINFKIKKNQISKLLNEFSNQENLRNSLENILLSPPVHYEDQQWKIIESLLMLLPLLTAHLKIIFDEEMIADHTEILLSALRALETTESSDQLMLNLDHKLKHLLIDEFQDTSLSHYRLLEKIIANWYPNDGHTIFIVGDPMQSIYSFREAEVGLFLRTQQKGIGNLKLKSLLLNTNFRSSINIINWLNNNFSKILPSFSDISLGAIPFKSSLATTTNPIGQIAINLLTNADDDAESSHVIKIIKNITNQDPNSTITILIRARSHFTKLAVALHNANLDYQGYELESLDNNMVIKDLFSLTKALLDPTDRISWIAILRAPWCGLTLKDLYQIVRGKHKLIWNNICDFQEISGLSIDGKLRLTKFKTALLPIFIERECMLWRDLIENAWLLLGGPATLNNTKELIDVETYFELLTTTIDIERLQKKLTGVYTKSTVAIDTKIQIMTIHKAKGLEFDHVIIPGINRITRNNKRELLLWSDRPSSTTIHQDSNLIIAPIAISNDKCSQIYKYLQLVEQKKSWYELGRVLYVAMTRAKKSIYLIGSIKQPDNIKALSGTLLEQLQPCFNKNWIKETTVPIITSPESEQLKSSKISRFTLDWVSPVVITLPSRNNQPHFTMINNQPRIIGVVLHHCLRQLSEKNLNDYKLSNQLLYWRKLLQQSGYIDINSGLKIVVEAITSTLNDSRGRWILAKHLKARNEFSITNNNDNNFDHYIIDRTFIDKTGYRWIIDYKTSISETKTLKDFLQEEKNKYSFQLLQYAKLMKNLYPKNPIKLGLYYPRFSGWLEITNSLISI
ncbi:MAG: UvrD-helicase domain-containing protein [Coxiellaceae bacterium]|jgi:ATP-dependent exoDNAse (exonuclease V) beta subunit|nr:UvrD-helicase domain-containing protein [Coxiellaceae bacterium]